MDVTCDFFPVRSWVKGMVHCVTSVIFYFRMCNAHSRQDIGPNRPVDSTKKQLNGNDCDAKFTTLPDLHQRLRFIAEMYCFSHKSVKEINFFFLTAR